MKRRLVVLVLGVLVACRVEEPTRRAGASASAPASAPALVPPLLAPSSIAAASASASASAVSTSPARPKVDPRALECLRRGLPKNFSREDYPNVDAVLSRCLRDTKLEANGLSGLRFGTETRTGRELEVLLYCDDMCPDYTRSAIAYVGVQTKKECVCLGGTPLLTSGWSSYAGCAPARSAPAAHFTNGREFMLRKDPASEQGNIRVFGGVIGSLLEVTGLTQGIEVVSVEGRPMRDFAALERELERFPKHPPTVIRVHANRGGAGREREYDIHYVPHTVMSGLWKTVGDIRRESSDPRACGPNVVIDYQRICANPAVSNPAAKRWAALLRLIETASRTSKPVAATPGTSSCRSVGELPLAIGFERGDEYVELRSVEWLP